MQNQPLVLINQTELDRLVKAAEKVEKLEEMVMQLYNRPELQQWISIAQICKDKMFGVSHFNSVKPILNEAVVSKSVRTLNGKYNLNDLLIFKAKF